MELLFLFIVMVTGVIVVGLVVGIIVGRRLDTLVARPEPESHRDPEPGPLPEPEPEPQLPEDAP